LAQNILIKGSNIKVSNYLFWDKVSQIA